MERTDRYLSFDILKGIGIIMVILVHSIQEFDDLNSIFDFFWFGQMGCQIFFVISGYLTASAWNRALSKSKSKKQFYLRRFFSIAPGYYLIIILCQLANLCSGCLFGMNIGFAKNRGIISIICNFLFLNGLLPFCNNDVAPGGWYIGTLVIFYLLFPFINCIYKKLKRAYFGVPGICNLMVFFIVLIAINILGHESFFLSNNGFVYFSFLVQFPCFLLGVQLQKEEAVEKLNEVIMCIGVALILFVISLVLFFANISKYSFLFIPTVFGYGVYFLLKAMLWYERNYSFKNNLLTYLGRKSYYMYLTHAFFAWTMMGMVRVVLDKLDIIYNQTVVYLILLPFVFVGTLFFANILEKICNIMVSSALSMVKDKM